MSLTLDTRLGNLLLRPFLWNFVVSTPGAFTIISQKLIAGASLKHIVNTLRRRVERTPGESLQGPTNAACSFELRLAQLNLNQTLLPTGNKTNILDIFLHVSNVKFSADKERKEFYPYWESDKQCSVLKLNDNGLFPTNDTAHHPDAIFLWTSKKCKCCTDKRQ